MFRRAPGDRSRSSGVRSLRDRPLGVMVAGALMLTLPGCGDDRSVAAFCGALRDAYEQVEAHSAAASGGDGLESFVALFATLGEANRLFHRLADVAPDEIRTDAEIVRDAMDQSFDASGNVISDPWGALGSAVTASVRSAASMQRLDAYISTNCGPPPFARWAAR